MTYCLGPGARVLPPLFRPFGQQAALAILFPVCTSLQTGFMWVSVQARTSGTTLKVGHTAVPFL